MQFIDIVKVIVIGIIEGITEWLPISSTGHMILADEFLKLPITPEFKEMFMVVIQLGAIMAVVYLYWNKLFPFEFKKGFSVKKDTMSLWFKIVVACIPAAIIGIPFDDKIDELFFNYQTVAIALIVYGVIFIVIEKKYKNKRFKVNRLADLTYQTALYIGIFQLLSLIPGTSRSGTTIIGAMLLGVSRGIAAEFTFFLAIPTMFGYSLIKMLKFGFSYTSMELGILALGVVTAFLVSVIAIKFLVGYIKKNDFKVFGYYRILLGAVILLYFLFIA